jgi:hypothetical protein
MRDRLQLAEETKERRRRRSRRFVAAILVSLVAVAGVLVWSAWRLRVREQVAGQLQRAGVVLTYESSCPEWVREWFGDKAAHMIYPKRLRRIAAAAIEDNQPALPSAITDDDLAVLDQFTRLESLDLRGAPITDAGLKHLTTLKQLTHVDLRGTGVTEEGVRNLQRALPNAVINR